MTTRLSAVLVRLLLCSGLVLGLLMISTPIAPVYAATIVVTNNADSGAGSLRQAIANAASGDTITFNNDYTITLASQLDIIDKTITITGAGHHITLSGNNAVRVFHVGQSGGSGNLTIDQLNIVNGKSTVAECAGSAVSCGGGLMLEYLTTATVLNSTFANNDGGLAGGAIYSYYGNPLTVINSTFINNHASAYGGAIEFFYGSATLTNNTFTGNSATGYGGAILNTWGTVTLRNNIFVKGASSINTCDSDFSDGGSTTDGGGNVRSGDNTCPGTTANPMLGTLGYYGGDVPTLPLLPGSAAIDAATANCPGTDQRGVARTATCDSGAYESRGFTLTKAGGDNQATLINTAFTQPLVISVTSAYAEPVDGGVVTFVGPLTGAGTNPITTTAAIIGGVALRSITANSISGGPYNVAASANGVSSSVNFALTNLKYDTATNLTSAPNPSTLGQAVTFTATVTSASGTPTGALTLTLDSTAITVPLNGNGAAVYVTTTLAVGNHPVMASYGGDTNFNASNGVLSGGQTVSDVPITGLSAVNSSPTRLTDSTFFTATISAGSNVTYHWTFGDGQTASGATALHTYTAAGTYTALVTATNSAGSVAASTWVTITNQQPVANAGSDQIALVNALVTLDGADSTDPDGHLPLTYNWTQSGGPAALLSSAVISRPTFTAPSGPTVLTFTLVVTDVWRAASMPSEVVVVVDDQALTNLHAVNDSPTRLGHTTAFTATIAAGSNVLYAWNFGDGQTASGVKVTHRYTQTGTYTATVTATNGVGSINATTLVTIEPVRLYLPLMMRN